MPAFWVAFTTKKKSQCPSINKEIKTMSMSDDNKVGSVVSLCFLSSDDQYRHYTSHWTHNKYKIKKIDIPIQSLIIDLSFKFDNKVT